MKRSLVQQNSSEWNHKKIKKQTQYYSPTFNHLIPNEVLALIFQYISDLKSFARLMLVNRQFHQVLFAPELECFKFVLFSYSSDSIAVLCEND